MNFDTLRGWLDHPSAEAIGWALVHSLWELALAGGLAAAAMVLLRRASARVRYITALAGLVVMVAAPAATLALLWPHPARLEQRAMMVGGVVPAIRDAVPAAAAVVPPAPLSARAMTAVRGALPALEMLYFLGVLLGAMRLGLGHARLRRLVQHATPLAGSAHARLQHLATRLRVRRAVRLLESALVEVPTVVGMLRPAILLPVAGWLCPALFRYFIKTPRELYVRAEAE